MSLVTTLRVFAAGLRSTISDQVHAVASTRLYRSTYSGTCPCGAPATTARAIAGVDGAPADVLLRCNTHVAAKWIDVGGVAAVEPVT